MNRMLIIFICSVIIAASALFSFPAVSWFDRWSIGILGFVIAIISFTELRKFPLKDHSHDHEPKV